MSRIHLIKAEEYESIEIPLELGIILNQIVENPNVSDEIPVKPKCTCPNKNGQKAPCKGKPPKAEGPNHWQPHQRDICPHKASTSSGQQNPDYNKDDKRILQASADCRQKRPNDDRCAYDKYPYLKECHAKKECSHLQCNCSTCVHNRSQKPEPYTVHPIRPWYPADNRPTITSIAIAKPTIDINDLELC